MSENRIHNALESMVRVFGDRYTNHYSEEYHAIKYAKEALKDCHPAIPWKSLSEELPKERVPVFLIAEDSHLNTGSDDDCQKHAFGWLSGSGDSAFWSVPGSRGETLKAFTHWMYAPILPCSGCNGIGVIGIWSEGPEGGYESYPCPDCAKDMKLIAKAEGRPDEP